MEPRTRLADGLSILHDDVAVVSVAQAWADRIRAAFRPQLARLFANDVARLLQADLHAEHVALWRNDGDDLIVLGAGGLNPRTRNSRLSPLDPVLQEADGGDIRYDHVAHRPPRGSEMPGLRSSEFALIWQWDGATPVAMVSVSGDTVPDGLEKAIRELMAALPWDQTTLR